MGSEWCTQQEVVEMANQIKAKDVGAYQAFVDKLVEKDPGLSGLFDKAKTP